MVEAGLGPVRLMPCPWPWWVAGKWLAARKPPKVCVGAGKGLGHLGGGNGFGGLGRACRGNLVQGDDKRRSRATVAFKAFMAFLGGAPDKAIIPGEPLVGGQIRAAHPFCGGHHRNAFAFIRFFILPLPAPRPFAHNLAWALVVLLGAFQALTVTVIFFSFFRPFWCPLACPDFSVYNVLAFTL